ncbi:MAG: bifunctional phosphoglucose/phosphomannose isomerase [Candidatus Thorarchaeota archaeon]
MSLDEIDREDMQSMVNGFPLMLGAANPSESAIESAIEASRTKKGGICLLGMGGSAIAGELCKGLLNDSTPIPIICVKDYSIPHFVDSNWIAIAVSYSGNTEETLSAFKHVQQRKCETYAITSGGMLQELATPRTCTLLPQGIQPRAALPLIFSVELALLETLIGRARSDLEPIRKNLTLLSESWPTGVTHPSKLAKELQGSIPLFMASGHLEAVAYRAKCQINENSKIASFYSILPEANHNEIESLGWFKSMGVLPIFIRSDYENPRVSARFNATSEIYEDEGAKPIHLWHPKNTKIEELLIHTFYLDLVSVELAKLTGADSVSVERIERLKRSLS